MNDSVLPHRAQTALNGAHQSMQRQDYGKAHKMLSMLLKEFPKNGEVNLALGMLCNRVEEFDQAVHYCSQACKLMPANYHAIFSLMDTFELVNAHADVKTLHDFMLAQFSQTPEVIYKAAVYNSEMGHFGKAKELCMKNIKLCEQNLETSDLFCYTWLLYTKLEPAIRTENTINMLKIRLKNVPNNSCQAMLLHYTLGEIFHHSNMAEEAFDHWLLANKIQHLQSNFDSQGLNGFLQDIKAAHSAVTHHNSPLACGNEQDGPVPIFIVGMPRTGSTLLETCLAKHSAIDTVGEATIISDQLARYFAQHFKQAYPQFMPTLLSDSDETMILLKNARIIYQQAIQKRQLTAAFIIDKLPANFQSIGLIKRVFPAAKIIHLSRDCSDVSLSIFRHHFASNEPYFCDLKQLNIYQKFYTDLMKLWDETYGRQIYALRYEDLVAAPIHAITKVLQYCGLEFEQHCVSTQTGDPMAWQDPSYTKPVKTLSAIQVRSPITNASVGSAKRYQSLMDAHLKGGAD